MLKPVMRRYIDYLKKQRKLKPIWACVDEVTEQILAKDFDWRSLAVAAEERFDPTAHNPNSNATRSNLAKKIAQAKNGGCKAVICDGLPDEKVRAQINERMEDWKGTREGKQMHTTSLTPWDDDKHRRFFYATEKSGRVRSLTCLYLFSLMTQSFADLRLGRTRSTGTRARLANQVFSIVPGWSEWRNRVTLVDSHYAAWRSRLPFCHFRDICRYTPRRRLAPECIQDEDTF